MNVKHYSTPALGVLFSPVCPIGMEALDMCWDCLQLDPARNKGSSSPVKIVPCPWCQILIKPIHRGKKPAAMFDLATGLNENDLMYGGWASAQNRPK